VHGDDHHILLGYARQNLHGDALSGQHHVWQPLPIGGIRDHRGNESRPRVQLAFSDPDLPSRKVLGQQVPRQVVLVLEIEINKIAPGEILFHPEIQVQPLPSTSQRILPEHLGRHAGQRVSSFCGGHAGAVDLARLGHPNHSLRIEHDFLIE
jgi:hypothetical protein